jgi:hypothetical protein
MKKYLNSHKDKQHFPLSHPNRDEMPILDDEMPF